MKNSYGEHENGQAIPENDLISYDTTNLDENKSYFGDENDEYIELTCNDLDLDIGVGYIWFDNYNESRHF